VRGRSTGARRNRIEYAGIVPMQANEFPRESGNRAPRAFFSSRSGLRPTGLG
jgi:hypothetical protein